MNTAVVPHVRRMRWWDIPSVEHIERNLFPDDHWSVDQWWRELAAEFNHYWVAESAHQIVGYAGLSVQVPDADIQTMAIANDYQGMGLGGQLLDFVLEAAAEFSVRFIFLEVRASNHAAMSMYESRHFKKISERRRYYPDGTDAVIMRRDKAEASA